MNHRRARRTAETWGLELRYDPSSKTITASVNEVELGVFSQAIATPKFIGIESTGFVNNFVVRKLP